MENIYGICLMKYGVKNVVIRQKMKRKKNQINKLFKLKSNISMKEFMIFTRKDRKKDEKEFAGRILADSKKDAVNKYCRNHNNVWVSAYPL